MKILRNSQLKEMVKEKDMNLKSLSMSKASGETIIEETVR